MIDYKNAERVPRLSLKTLVGAFPIPKIGATVWLAHFYGFCSSYDTGQDDRGIKVTFNGDFLGHSLAPVGKKEPRISVMRAPLLTLPIVATEKLTGAIADDGSNVAEFGFRIGVQGEDSAASFRYLVASFIGLDAYSPLDRMLERQPEEHWRVGAELAAVE